MSPAALLLVQQSSPPALPLPFPSSCSCVRPFLPGSFFSDGLIKVLGRCWSVGSWSAADHADHVNQKGANSRAPSTASIRWVAPSPPAALRPRPAPPRLPHAALLPFCLQALPGSANDTSTCRAVHLEAAGERPAAGLEGADGRRAGGLGAAAGRGPASQRRQSRQTSCQACPAAPALGHTGENGSCCSC